MAKPSYRVYDTPEETLKIWAKNLNYDLTAAGTVDDLVITHKNFVLADGARSWFKAAGDNTGAVTVKVSDSEIKDLKDIDGNALSAGDITEDYYYEIVYDSTSDFFVLAPKGAGKYLSGSVTSSSGALNFINEAGGTVSLYYVHVTGLTFEPIAITLINTVGQKWIFFNSYNLATNSKIFTGTTSGGSLFRLTGNAIVSSSEFKLPSAYGSLNYYWQAWG